MEKYHQLNLKVLELSIISRHPEFYIVWRKKNEKSEKAENVENA
jgi:hypothetical protein